jgi:hypothetical protein
MCYVLTSIYLVTVPELAILLADYVPLSVLAHHWLLSTPLTQLIKTLGFAALPFIL